MKENITQIDTILLGDHRNHLVLFHFHFVFFLVLFIFRFLLLLVLLVMVGVTITLTTTQLYNNYREEGGRERGEERGGGRK